MYDPSEENKLEGDPGVKVRKMLDLDMVRNEIRERTTKLIASHRQVFNCSPAWVRVSFDLVYKTGGPAFNEPCTICGLVFRLALESTNQIEVGNSVFEDTHENQTPEQAKE